MNKSNKVSQDKERKGYKFRLIVPNSDIERQLTKIVGVKPNLKVHHFLPNSSQNARRKSAPV
jgi:hypothetical protein